MIQCIMAGCINNGNPNYICFLCSEKKVFCCEGCELQLLNDLRAIGKIELVCTTHRTKEQLEERIRQIKVPILLKRAETLRQALVDSTRFEESTVLRDLSALVRSLHRGVIG